MNEIEKSIDILRKYSVKNAIVKDSEYESFNLAISALTEKLNGGWVKCEDGLPEAIEEYNFRYSSTVNFKDEDGMYYNGEYDYKRGVWINDTGNGIYEVIAWKTITPYQPTDTVNHIQI